MSAISPSTTSQTYWQKAQGYVHRTFSACKDGMPEIIQEHGLRKGLMLGAVAVINEAGATFSETVANCRKNPATLRESLPGLSKGLVVGAGSAIAGTVASCTNPATAAVGLISLVLLMRPKSDSALAVNSHVEKEQALQQPFSPLFLATRFVEVTVGAATTVTAQAVSVFLSPIAGFGLGKFVIAKINDIAWGEMQNTLSFSTAASTGSAAGFCIGGVPGAFVAGAVTGYVFELMANRPEADDD